jgi:hypothetical protein
MVIIKDILIGLWQSFCSLVAFFADKTRSAGIEADPLILAALAIVLVIWIGSGAWAGSIAGSRHHSTKLHFVLGLLAPYLYPLIILFAMDVKGAGERDRGRKEQLAAAQAEEEEKQRIEEMLKQTTPRDEFDDPSMEETVEWNMDYFDRISRDENGNPTGPWRLVYGDTEIVALRIVEALPQNVLVEVEGEDDKGQRLRVPYSRIISCDPA